MKNKIALAVSIVAMAGLVLVGSAKVGETQQAGGALTIGIYTPTVDFGGSKARLDYVQALARAVGTATGRTVQGRSFTSLSQLKASKVQFAIVDGQCYATNSSWKLLASSRVGGSTKREWGLYSNAGSSIQNLKGKKLAYVKTGCRDTDFIENAMLESEVGMGYFGGKVAKQDLPGAVAEVATLKGAQAVFAPSGSQRGLTKVFATISVPNPAFVALDKTLSKDIVSKARKAVIGYGGSGAIDGWAAGKSGEFSGLRGRLGKRRKQAVFARPSMVRVDASDVLIDPTTLNDTELTGISQHFKEPSKRQ